jgi:chromate reductase, NAD(P)H dehydrogenase (quinone)
MLRVVGIAGSLRKGSFNRALLHAAIELAPVELQIDVFARIGEFPLYDADLEAHALPEPVEALKKAMRDSDGILIATPEYNHSIPGVLKNAIDWASRPGGAAAYRWKPIAIMGATPGMGGTIRGQTALRQVLSSDTYLMPGPEVFVARAAEKFDAEGRLTDEPTRKHLAGFLKAAAAWYQRFRADV